MDDSSDGATSDGATVFGTATVSTPVDRVAITIAVEIIRPDAGEAFRLAADTVTRLLAVLADDGVDARAVRTLDLSLGPRTEWVDTREVLIGYQASQRLLVKLDGLAGLERLLSDTATRTGPGVRIENVTLTAEDADAALEQARERAWAEALTKAQHLARLAGRALGPVQWIQEGSTDHGPFRRSAPVALAGGAFAKDMPVAGGDTDVTAAVSVRWRFAD
jgi:uncharacterized protein YggE